MQWKVYDFKGLDCGDLALEPGLLTLLAGANSSGKSSLLQSVLMVAQSLQNHGRVILNGPLTRLGEATDLVRDGAVSTRIAFVAKPEHSRRHGTAMPSTSREPLDTFVEYGLRPDNDGGTLTLHDLTLKVDQADTQGLTLSRHNARTGDLKRVSEILQNADADILQVKTTMDENVQPFRTYVAFTSLAPIAIVKLGTEQSISTEYKRQMIAATKRLMRVIKAPVKSRNLESISDDLTTLDRELQRGLAEPKLAKLLDTAFEAWPQGPDQAANRVARLLSLEYPEQQRLITDFASHGPASDYILVPLSPRRSDPYSQRERGLLERTLIKSLRRSLDALTHLGSLLSDFAPSVQYLGPLRDEPRVVWTQWNEQANGLPVGSRGEYSAAVLSRRGGSEIGYSRPNGAPVRGHLNDAVNEWLAYMSIGDSVEAHSRGKLGVGVEVKLGGSARDLTSVGVGVSQALPLIVATLSAPARSIFLVEQPELHLHPAAQARLADFLVTARPDMALIVETHSEALLTRIRRRVAEGKIDAKRVRVVFVDNSGSGATTRNLHLSEYGDLSEWPAGFMSGDDDDTRAILQANLQRAKSASAINHA